jgi:endonuclease/exonuclease/phosphatase family metal-dependent hydrolase
VRKRWTFLLPLVGILIGWQSFTTFFSMGFSSEAVVTKEIRLISYNVRYFNRYNWNKDPETANKLIKMINNEHADIVCFQEFLLGNTKHISASSIKRKLKNFPYSYINKRKDLAIFSKYKILNTEEIKFDKGSHASAFYADVKFSSERVRIFNCHLESNRFNTKDYEFINNLKQNKEGQNIDAAMGITKRLRNAFKKRALQADLLNKMITSSRHKTIICMDMNDTPVSYVYRNTRGELEDAFLSKGSGIGTTYVGDFPSFRIDYIFHDNRIECVSYKTKKVKFSDHYPLIVSFRNDL